MQPAIDATLGDGRYRLRRRLGAGGMASVWLAGDERLGRPVAVKIVADTLAGDEQWLRRFQREAQAAARLSHPWVVPVFDYGVEDGRPYLVMEYVAGGTLAHRLADSTAAVPPADRLARELLEALAAVHAAGILHRDVKPANLLLDAGGHVRLTDFGIAQAQDATSLTQTGMVVGTVRYLAPEVAAGEPASIQSDLYSAGVVIREVTGRGASGPLAELIDRLTADEPPDRPASADAALELLSRVPEATTATRPLGPGGAPTRPIPTAAAPRRAPTAPTRPAAPGRHRRRPRTWPALGAAAVVAMIVLAIVLAAPGGSSRPATLRLPSPASARDAVSIQVRALERIVQRATRR